MNLVDCDIVLPLFLRGGGHHPHGGVGGGGGDAGPVGELASKPQHPWSGVAAERNLCCHHSLPDRMLGVSALPVSPPTLRMSCQRL